MIDSTSDCRRSVSTSGSPAAANGCATSEQNTWSRKRGRMVRIVLRHAPLRVILLGLGHSLVFFFTFWAAFCLRFDFAVPQCIRPDFLENAGLGPRAQACRLLRSRTLPRLVAVRHLRRLGLALASGRAVAAGPGAINHFALDSRIPRTVIILDTVIRPSPGNASGKLAAAPRAVLAPVPAGRLPARPPRGHGRCARACWPTRFARIRNRGIASADSWTSTGLASVRAWAVFRSSARSTICRPLPSLAASPTSW